MRHGNFLREAQIPQRYETFDRVAVGETSSEIEVCTDGCEDLVGLVVGIV